MNEHFIIGIKTALRELIPERRLSRLSEETLLRDLGIDSLDMVRLISQLEDVFRISFSDEDLVPENFGTVASLMHLLGGKKAEERGHDSLLSS